jgi:hypothetical protein
MDFRIMDFLDHGFPGSWISWINVLDRRSDVRIGKSATGKSATGKSAIGKSAIGKSSDQDQASPVADPARG